MGSLAGLEVTFFVPTALAPVLVLLMIGLIAGGVVAGRRLAARHRQLAVKAASLRAQLAARADQTAELAATRESYRHFVTTSPTRSPTPCRASRPTWTTWSPARPTKPAGGSNTTR